MSLCLMHLMAYILTLKNTLNLEAFTIFKTKISTKPIKYYKSAFSRRHSVEVSLKTCLAF